MDEQEHHEDEEGHEEGPGEHQGESHEPVQPSQNGSANGNGKPKHSQISGNTSKTHVYEDPAHPVGYMLPSSPPNGGYPGKQPGKQGNRTKNKSKRVETRLRIEVARKMLARGMYQGEIKRILSSHYGVSGRMVEKYIGRARQLIIEATGKSKQEHIADSYSFYIDVQANDKLPVASRLRARENIDKLFALPQPIKIAPTNIDGTASYRVAVEDLTIDQLMALDALRQREIAIDEATAEAGD